MFHASGTWPTYKVECGRHILVVGSTTTKKHSRQDVQVKTLVSLFIQKHEIPQYPNQTVKNPPFPSAEPTPRN